MNIQRLLGNTIVDKASDALVLALTPKKDLNPEKLQDKISLIQARNRVLNALNDASQKIPDAAQKNLLQEKIRLVKEFFYEIGGDIENTTAKLSLLSPTKLIEGSIPSSIIASTKPNQQCSREEMAKKKEDEELRDKIIQAAFQKAVNKTTADNINLFLQIFNSCTRAES